MKALVETAPDEFPMRLFFTIPFVFVIHICILGLLFSSRSVLNIEISDIEFVKVDVVPDLSLQKTVIEIDIEKTVPVDPEVINPKRLEIAKGESDVQPALEIQEKKLVEPVQKSTLIPAPTPSPSPTPVPTPAPEPNLSPTLVPKKVPAPASRDSELFALTPLNRGVPVNDETSFGTDLRAGLDPVVINCLEFLEFTEKAQPCLNLKPLLPETVSVDDECLVKIDVLADGTVGNFSVRDCPHQGFLKVTRDAIKDWRYVPAVVDGIRVAERDRSLRVVYCGGDVGDYIAYGEGCPPSSSASGDFLNKPLSLDKQALERAAKLRALIAQSELSPGGGRDLSKKSLNEDLSLADILK